MTNINKLLYSLFALFLNGCCAFVPCHPGSSYVGKIINSDGAAIHSSKLMLYGTLVNIADDGCFKVHMADSYPFELLVSAEGYKNISSVPKFGYYRINIILSEANSTDHGLIEWKSISTTEYENYSCR